MWLRGNHEHLFSGYNHERRSMFTTGLGRAQQRRQERMRLIKLGGIPGHQQNRQRAHALRSQDKHALDIGVHDCFTRIG